jgi:ribosomal protein L7/L12
MHPHENETTMTQLQLGQAYDTLEPDLKAYLDSVIRFGQSKIATIRFLRARLGIGLTLAKILYEEREKFLNQTPNPFGW